MKKSVQEQHARIVAELSADQSERRTQLTGLVLDRLGTLPLRSALADDTLLDTILTALTQHNAQRVVETVGLPAVERISARLSGFDETLGEFLPESVQTQIRAMVASGKGPRFAWLSGAIDRALIRQLVGPVVQQVLVQFTQKLPIPGASATAGGGKGGPSLGGIAGMMAKQFAQGASQLAEVGRGVMGGLGAEIERRMQQVARDFSQTAMAEFRTAMIVRLKSEEGQEILAQLRDHATEHVFRARMGDVVTDLLHLPMDDIAATIAPTVAQAGQQSWLKLLLEAELRAALDTLSEQSLRDLLVGAAIEPQVRLMAQRVADPLLRELFGSEEFGAWLARVLES